MNREKTALLLIVFGTAVARAERAYGLLETRICSAYPGIPLLTAYCSPRVVRKLRGSGRNVLMVEEALGRLAAGLLTETASLYDAVVPVPLHWTRFLRRGYNQSALFAEELSRWTGIPVRRMLRRKRRTPRQAFLTRNERNLNIRGAFSIFDSTAAEKRSILLVDDVMTTGATLGEAAGVLLNSGAARVDVLVIARRQRN